MVYDVRLSTLLSLVQHGIVNGPVLMNRTARL